MTERERESETQVSRFEFEFYTVYISFMHVSFFSFYLALLKGNICPTMLPVLFCCMSSQGDQLFEET